MAEFIRPKPVVLVVMDGFGYSSRALSSPWQQATHPVFSEIEKNYPFTTLQASALAVGLPWGEPGNSEVGHLTIGAGKIIYTHLPRIISAIQDGTFFENKILLAAADNTKKKNSNLHIMGLFSSGSVHAYAEHLYALLDLAKNQEVKNVFIHLFTDGRDASPKEGAGFIKKLEEKIATNYPNTKIASVVGRHYSMDRDGNWGYTEKAYKLLTESAGEEFLVASDYVQKSYEKNLDDEVIEPGFLKGAPSIKDGDSLIFFNYREDSTRQLTKAFALDDFDNFSRRKINDLVFVTMTQYEAGLPVFVAFPPLANMAPLAQIISNAGLSQLHIAESDKYAHVTYFFNGGKEEPFSGESRELVPSPRVAQYDEAPEMSAAKIVEKVILEIQNNSYDFILINFANADMVGHTGNFEACIKAVEELDRCIGRLLPAVLSKNGILIITADHGNVEEKIYQFTGQKRTNHTTNPVPFYLVGEKWQNKVLLEEVEIAEKYRKTEGTLTDVAPTVLEVMGLPKPAEMTGKSLTPILRRV